MIPQLDLARKTVEFLEFSRTFFDKGKKHIFIVCFPKSGSTFLYRTLEKITKFKIVTPILAAGRTEQEINKIILIDNFNKNAISQLHVKASDYTVKTLSSFHMQPVVLVRNIFDVVVSLRDHLNKEGLSTPMCYFNSDFKNLSKIEQYNQIIELAVPWYIHFYSSWFDKKNNSELKVLWLTYEDMILNKFKTIVKVLEFYNIKHNKESVKEIIENSNKIKSRFNKGIAGRGQTELSEIQQNIIKSYIRFYPSIDFSSIGL